MSKRCYKSRECDPAWSRTCEHAHTLQQHASSFFSPAYTGEHCPAYTRLVVESDPWHGLANMAGAHE